MIIPVILSGGSGTRLWPLSTPEKPKQFLPLVTEQTLFQETLLRLAGLAELAGPIVVCNEAHRLLVAEQLREIEATAQAIVLEPEGRNTAPAIAVAALLAQASDAVISSENTVSDPLMLVLPADHVIADATALRSSIMSATHAAREGHLVTFGIVPTHAETGYGYIEQGESRGEWSRVERFVEKPDSTTAEKYVDSGRYLWNSGMFLFSASAFLDELGRLAPEIMAACEAAATSASQDADFTRLGRHFLESPADSIDYAVMEKTELAAVVPLDAGWSDVGSWAAIHEALAKDTCGNALKGDVLTLDAKSNLVRSDLRKIALLGVDNLVVIDAGDTVLIMDRERSQDVKLLLEELKSKPSRI